MTLDNPVFTGRRRTIYTRRSTHERRIVATHRGATRLLSDVRSAPQKMTVSPVTPSAASASSPSHAVAAIRTAHPALRRPSRSLVLKREVIARKPKIRRKRSLRQKLPMALATLLFIFGLGVGIAGLSTNHRAAAQIRHLSQRAEAASAASNSNATPADVPLESKPTANIESHHVAASLPRVLAIPKLGVKARVLRVTVNSKNELGTPNNIFDTAWYSDSAKPGEAGAMLIDGHVSGPTQNGVFYNLKKLIKNDKITVQRGDGKMYTYSVVTVKTYDADKVDMAAALTPIAPGKPGLNLITCAGKLDASGTHFQQRTVVFAAQD